MQLTYCEVTSVFVFLSVVSVIGGLRLLVAIPEFHKKPADPAIMFLQGGHHVRPRFDLQIEQGVAKKLFVSIQSVGGLEVKIVHEVRLPTDKLAQAKRDQIESCRHTAVVELTIAFLCICLPILVELSEGDEIDDGLAPLQFVRVMGETQFNKRPPSLLCPTAFVLTLEYLFECLLNIL